LLHHRGARFDDQRKIFERITVASAYLDDPETALTQIDRAFDACDRLKRPIYIELPRDRVQSLASPSRFKPEPKISDPTALSEAAGEALSMLQKAKNPVLLAGVEIHRFGLQDKLLRWVEKSGIRIAATILGKSVISESHANYLGVYEGRMGHESVREAVESSDCLMLLGVLLTDINLGIFTAKLDAERIIAVNEGKLSIRHHHYDNVAMADFLDALLASDLKVAPAKKITRPDMPQFSPTNKKITIDRVFACINHFIDDKTMVVADVGDALFGAIDLLIRGRTEFLSPAYYASIGFGVPGALGAQLAKPDLRPLVIVGDGAFQMTGVELSTIARFGLNPIVVLLNNEGYGTERPMRDGPFNDILNWNYSKLPDLLGHGSARKIETESQLFEALTEAKKPAKEFVLLEVVLDRHDYTSLLKRLAQGMASKIKK
jgi:indolepyruvate decarboxylase